MKITHVKLFARRILPTKQHEGWINFRLDGKPYTVMLPKVNEEETRDYLLRGAEMMLDVMATILRGAGDKRKAKGGQRAER